MYFYNKEALLNLLRVLIKLDLSTKFQQLKISILSLISIQCLKNAINEDLILELLKQRRRLNVEIQKEIVSGVLIVPYRLGKLETLIELTRTFFLMSYKILSQSINENKTASITFAAFLLVIYNRFRIEDFLIELISFLRNKFKK